MTRNLFDFNRIYQLSTYTVMKYVLLFVLNCCLFILPDTSCFLLQWTIITIHLLYDSSSRIPSQLIVLQAEEINLLFPST